MVEPITLQTLLTYLTLISVPVGAYSYTGLAPRVIRLVIETPSTRTYVIDTESRMCALDEEIRTYTVPERATQRNIGE